MSIIIPLTPKRSGWSLLPTPPAWVSLGYEAQAWYHAGAGIAVISAVEVAKDDDGIDRGPEYHLSISKRVVDGSTSGCGVRCSSQEAQQVLADFGMEGGEEDNHTPSGIVRNFWRPVADRFIGMQCACKADEPAMVEDKGDFVWRGVTR